ncbi:rhamnosyltransferase WsaF family glycosyltransferase [Nevskia soli]|uniref:rhamnosyltransferase WsaF family glycosyltransferase n=1 Tax=Nevskia soli TaxID=418856 RepID=UPI0012FCEA89|nr:glycosyltransferase family 1 protein [Nevskia soli]
MNPKIAWLLPKLIAGSGGHRTILQHAAILEQSDFDCSLYIEPDGRKIDAAAEIKQLFDFDFKRVRYGWDNIPSADLVFATVWYSAKVVKELPFPCVKAYFVQDYEACFNPMGDGYLMAESSYRYGLHPVTIGRWLSNRLRLDFGLETDYFDFCADLSTYRPLNDAVREKAICFVYQPDKPRRCSRLGIEALGIVKDRIPDVNIYLYGSTHKNPVQFNHTNLGLIGLEACNALYNKCSVGLCISSSNPSRVPFEMMASGLPVVELWRENTLYDFPEEATLLCDQTPEALAEGIMDLLSNDKKRVRMGGAALSYMRQRPLDLGFSQFMQAVIRLLNEQKHQNINPIQKTYTKPAIVPGPHVATRPLSGAGGNNIIQGKSHATRAAKWLGHMQNLFKSSKVAAWLRSR